MKAKIVYMALALVLVFSLAAAIVPAAPVMADESEILIEDLEVTQSWDKYWTIYTEWESSANVTSNCGSGTVNMTDLVLVMTYANAPDPWVCTGPIGGFLRGDLSATLNDTQYSGSVSGYIGPTTTVNKTEVWGTFVGEDIEGRYNMVLNSDAEDIYVIDTYTIDITWKDDSQCCFPLDVVESQFDIIPGVFTQAKVFWGYYDFTGSGTSTGTYDGSFNVTAGHEQYIDDALVTEEPWLSVINEGYAALNYTCDLGGGQAKGYILNDDTGPSVGMALKFKGAIGGAAFGGQYPYAGYMALLMQHCEGLAPAGEGCFIATAAYGTESAEEIDVLRSFRDEVLLESALGSQLVDLYYQTSPPVADFIAENGILRTIVRELVIDPMVSVATFTQGIWGK